MTVPTTPAGSHPEFQAQYEAASVWLRDVYRRAWKQAGRPRLRRDSVEIRRRTARAVASANAHCIEKTIAARQSRIESWILARPEIALMGLKPPLDGEPDLENVYN